MSEKQEAWRQYLKARKETTNFARQFLPPAAHGNECIKKAKTFNVVKDGPIFDKLLKKEKDLLNAWKKLNEKK